MKSLIAAGLIAALAPTLASAQTAPAASDLDRGETLRRAGQPEQAIAPLEAATREHPQDADAWLNLGLAYATTGRLDDAERALERAQTIAPNYPDVQIARARVAYFRQQPAEAARRLTPVLAAHPDNAEALALLRELQAARAAGVAPWRVDVTYTQARLSKALPRADSETVSVTRRFADGRFLGGEIERTRQFDQTDVYAEVTGGARSGYLALGGATKAIFRPKWAVRGGIYGDALRVSGWTFQPLADLSWARYAVGDVRSGTLGLDVAQAERLTLQLRWIHVVDERDDYRTGYAVRGEWRLPESPLALSAALSDAPESSEGRTQRVKTTGAGVAVDVGGQTTWRVFGAHERRPAYTRDAVTASLTRLF